ncbi:MAG TPA: phosphoenolpyruvate kinase [Acidimicrobiia bacterium]|nr:phosphoenolpyruvate kinase [Acidimicrobiia bacterium]
MTLSADSMKTWAGRLQHASARIAADFPGDGPERQPVHTVYGGAQLFSASTPARLGELAEDFASRWAAGPAQFESILGLEAGLAERVHGAVMAKLEQEPVEDFRIDFEDGYGHRSDQEEDRHAIGAAQQVAEGMGAGTLSPFIGIRVKSMSGELHGRALRTMDLFVTTLVEEAGRLPDGFTVTLPKIQDLAQVEVTTEALAELESELGIDRIPIELMVETPQTVVDVDGTSGVAKWVDAAAGRVRGAHFGTYDYTASLNITAAYQTMDHPACDFARHVLQVSLAGTGVWLSDGATNVMPVGDDPEVVHGAMRLHYDHIRHSLSHAYYQGWDLHPAQLVTRYTAVYAFFMEGLEAAGERLSNFVEAAAKATLVGDVFDDAATGQGLLNYFLRAINCGAITEEEATTRTGLTVDELRTRSFLRILEGRREV